MTKRSQPPARSEPPPSRRRRTGDEARTAILDAAEKRLVDGGPAGIRLQEVAADVGIAHPTVLHHFGSREGLVEAVVARALDSLRSSLLGAMREAQPGPENVESMLMRVQDALASGGNARAFLWLALSGHVPTVEELHVRDVAEAVHEIRRERRTGPTPMPAFEDTYFTVLLPALALLSLSVIDPPGKSSVADAQPCSAARFRTWLARVIHRHLEQG